MVLKRREGFKQKKNLVNAKSINHVSPRPSSKANNLRRCSIGHIVKTQRGDRVVGLVHEKCGASVVRFCTLAGALAHLLHQILDDWGCLFHGLKGLLGDLRALAVGSNDATPFDLSASSRLSETGDLSNILEKLIQLLLLGAVNAQAPVQTKKIPNQRKKNNLKQQFHALECVVNEKLSSRWRGLVLKLHPVEARILFEASDRGSALVLAALEEQTEPNAAVFPVGLKKTLAKPLSQSLVTHSP